MYSIITLFFNLERERESVRQVESMCVCNKERGNMQMDGEMKQIFDLVGI